MSLQPPIPKHLPDIPPYIESPWSAEVVQAYRGLQAGFRVSRAALNLDESDPIRLGHQLHQARNIMLPVVEALGRQTSNPLPPGFIREIHEAITILIDSLHVALNESTTAFVAFAYGLIF